MTASHSDVDHCFPPHGPAHQSLPLERNEPSQSRCSSLFKTLYSISLPFRSYLVFYPLDISAPQSLHFASQLKIAPNFLI